MKVNPDTEEMSETERQQAVERAGIPDPANGDGGDDDGGLVEVQ